MCVTMDTRFWFGTVIVMLCVMSEGYAAGFVSIKNSVVHLRSGPGVEYPVLWVYEKRHLPLAVESRVGNWVNVCDFENSCGWMKSSVLSSRRFVMTTHDAVALSAPSFSSRQVVRAGKMSIFEFVKCNQEWCMVIYARRKIWFPKHDLWGVE